MMNRIIDRALEYLLMEKSICGEDADIYRFGLECVIVIYLWTPIENENNLLNSVERQNFRKQSVVILFIVNIFLCGTTWQNMIISRYLSNGIIMAAALLMLGKAAERIKAIE